MTDRDIERIESVIAYLLVEVFVADEQDEVVSLFTSQMRRL